MDIRLEYVQLYVQINTFWMSADCRGTKKAPLFTGAEKMKTISIAIVAWVNFPFNRRNVPIGCHLVPFLFFWKKLV